MYKRRNDWTKRSVGWLARLSSSSVRHIKIFICPFEHFVLSQTLMSFLVLKIRIEENMNKKRRKNKAAAAAAVSQHIRAAMINVGMNADSKAHHAHFMVEHSTMDVVAVECIQQQQQQQQRMNKVNFLCLATKSKDAPVSMKYTNDEMKLK